MKRLTLALSAFTLVFLAAGCGQSGPLYIPGNPSKISNPPPAAESTAEEEEGQENGNNSGDKNGDADKE